jgi:hypothetical protein
VNTGGITVAFPSARTADASVTGYAIFRAQATPPANIGGSYTCPAYVAPAIGSSPQTPPPSPWAQLATVADVQAANAAATEPASYYYNDTTAVPGSNVAQPNEYCYAVSSQAPNAAGSTQTGTARTAAQNPFLGAAAQAASTAPTFTQLVQTSPTTAIAYYNQPINTATCDTTASTPPAPPFDYTAYVANGGVNSAQTISQVACADTTYTIGATTYTNGGQATITFANSLPAGTLVVTSQKGADGNTVCALGSTTNCQAVGQSVQTAAANAAPSLAATSGSAGAHSITTTWNQNVNHANVTQLTIYSNSSCTTAVGGTNTYSAGDGTSAITITNPNITTAGTDYILIGSGFVTGAVNGLPNGAVTCTQVTVGA